MERWVLYGLALYLLLAFGLICLGFVYLLEHW